jgi:hypothetical protein
MLVFPNSSHLRRSAALIRCVAVQTCAERDGGAFSSAPSRSRLQGSAHQALDELTCPLQITSLNNVGQTQARLIRRASAVTVTGRVSGMRALGKPVGYRLHGQSSPVAFDRHRGYGGIRLNSSDNQEQAGEQEQFSGHNLFLLGSD